MGAVVAIADLRQRDGVSTLAERLKFAIAMRRTSADALDAKLTPPRKKYTAYVANGRRENPGHETVRQLAVLLDVDLAWLSAGEGPDPTPDYSAAARSTAYVPAPVWRRDPAWAVERDMAIQHKPDALPLQYIEEMGDAVIAGGRRPTWPLILDVAKACWLADVMATQRSTVPPQSGVTSRDEPASAAEGRPQRVRSRR